MLPSGKRLHNYGKSPCYSSVNPLFLWPCSIAFCMFTREYIHQYPSIIPLLSQFFPGLFTFRHAQWFHAGGGLLALQATGSDGSKVRAVRQAQFVGLVLDRATGECGKPW